MIAELPLKRVEPILALGSFASGGNPWVGGLGAGCRWRGDRFRLRWR